MSNEEYNKLCKSSFYISVNGESPDRVESTERLLRLINTQASSLDLACKNSKRQGILNGMLCVVVIAQAAIYFFQ